MLVILHFWRHTVTRLLCAAVFSSSKTVEGKMIKFYYSLLINSNLSK